MTVLRSTVAPDSDEFRANRAHQLALVERLDEQLRLAVAGGGERYVARHRARGRLTVRERIELLLDQDAPFLELSPLAAWGTSSQVGASMVTGIGVVAGVECVVIANDPTVRGGAMNPYTLKKTLRAMEIARLNRLPLINLVESGGADLPTQADLFVPAGRIFRDLTAAVGARHPDDRARVRQLDRRRRVRARACATTRCSSIERAKVFLGGPPLVKMATGEESDDEELGGADDALAGVGPVGDYFARRRARLHLRIGREIVARPQLAQARARPPRPRRTTRCTTPTSCSASPRSTCGCPFDPREVIARIVDGSRVRRVQAALRHAASSPAGPRSTATRSGILANARGVLFMEEAQEGDRVHPARQPDRHAAALPAEHHRLHGRQGVRAGAGSSRTAPR